MKLFNLSEDWTHSHMFLSQMILKVKAYPHHSLYVSLTLIPIHPSFLDVAKWPRSPLHTRQFCMSNEHRSGPSVRSFRAQFKTLWLSPIEAYCYMAVSGCVCP